MLTKQEALFGRGAWAESSRVTEPRRTALPRGSQSRVYGDGLVSGLSLAIVLTQGPSWRCTHCSAKMEAIEENSGKWEDTWHLLLIFTKLFQLVIAYYFLVPYQDFLS